jgi:carbamoyltransferase
VNLLGVGGLLHDPSAALLVNEVLVAAIENEKVTRHHREISTMPIEAIKAVLAHSRKTLSDIDLLVTNWDAHPLSHFGYLPTIYRHLIKGTDPRPSLAILFALAASHSPTTFRLQLRQTEIPPVVRVKHHLAHVGLSFTLSPFEEAAVAIIDGASETAATSLFHAAGRRIKQLATYQLPYDSLGNIFAMCTQHLGFRMLGDEHKVMALAAFGERHPRFEAFFDRLIREREEGGYWIDRKLVGAYLKNGYAFPRAALDGLIPPRRCDEPLGAIHYAFARAMQQRLGDVVVGMISALRRRTGSSRLCLGGGVAMNSVINGRIASETGFDTVYIPPAAHDGGTSAGAAAYYGYHILGLDRPSPLDSPFLGPAYPDSAIEQILRRSVSHFRRVQDPPLDAAVLLAMGEIIAWFQGPAEFGPRALGNRSLLADPRDEQMRVRLSEMVKERESFRPLAPAVLAEHYSNFFPTMSPNPYMTMVGKASLAAKSAIAAAIHVDGSSRPQYVDVKRYPLFHALISRFYTITGVPALLNTSFNLSGEPIVLSPSDALRTFYTSSLTHMFIGPFHISKTATNSS